MHSIILSDSTTASPLQKVQYCMRASIDRESYRVAIDWFNKLLTSSAESGIRNSNKYDAELKIESEIRGVAVNG